MATSFLVVNRSSRPLSFFVQSTWPHLLVMPATGVVPPNDDLRVVVSAAKVARQDFVDWYRTAASVSTSVYLPPA